MRKDTWRLRSRREIEETTVAAREAIQRAKVIALQKTKEVETDGGPPVLEPLDIGDELDRVGYALLHVQAAENKLSFLRSLIEKRQERLETERERQIAYGEDAYRLLTEEEGPKKRKRLPKEALRAAIAAEWRIATERGQTDTRWGQRLTRDQIARGLGISESTVGNYLREMERSTA